MEKIYARMIINTLGGTGTPPEFGLEYFTVGLTPYLNVIEEEYLASFIKMGGSSFKLVVGGYGGGKTHFLYCIRDLAWKSNYVVSYVPLSPKECPFDKLELVYKAIVAGIMPPMSGKSLIEPYNKGIDALIRTWHQNIGKNYIETYLKSIAGVESASFLNAVKWSFKLLLEEEEEYLKILQWLKGEDIPFDVRNKYSITERLDKSTAPRIIRSLAQWIREIGYSGIIFLFDEAERGLSIQTSKEKRAAMDNLRQIIDECGNSRIPSTMMFYAIPDETQLLDEKLPAYEAVRQRLRGSIFEEINPTGAVIRLDRLSINEVDFLTELGIRLSKIYEVAYDYKFNSQLIDKTIATFANAVYNYKYIEIGRRRLFVKSIIQALHLLRKEEKEISAMEIKRIIGEAQQEERKEEEF